MNIKELYEGAVFYKSAFDNLQAHLVEPNSHQNFTTITLAPEILEDKLLKDWLAYNYVFCTDSAKDGTPIMGRIGGLMPAYKKDDKDCRIMAVNTNTINSIISGQETLEQVYGSASDFDKADELVFASTGLPLENINGVICVDGAIEFAHFDFVTRVGRNNPLDCIMSSPYCIMESTGNFFVIGRDLAPGERYVFNVPFNPKIHNLFKNISSANCNQRLSMLKKHLSGEIIPPDFIAGFRIKYDKAAVYVAPVVSRSEIEKHNEFFKNEGITPNDSKINLLGTNNGVHINCFNQGILDALS